MKLVAYCIAVFAAVMLTYLPSVRYEMVSLDDHEYVYMNRHVLSGLSCDNVLWAIKSCGYSSNWHPLTWISLQADASLFGEIPAAQTDDCPDDSFAPLSAVMHAHNVLLHAANASLAFLLVVLMIKRLDPDLALPLPLAALCVLVWAIHPLRTEVVCWVSERKESLSVFWMLLTMILWISSRSVTRHVLALVCFALALAAKPVAVTLPVVLFSWDWVMRGRRFGRSLAAIVPFLFLSMGACALTLAAQVSPIEVGARFSLWEKIVMSLSAPVIYLRQAIWPVGLSALYMSKPPVPWVELALGIVLFSGAVAVCVFWLVRRRSAVLSLLVFAVAWCLVSLVPMLGIVKVGDQPHSDRYTYWAGCGLAAIVAIAVLRYVKGREKELIKALAAVVAVLAAATCLRMPVWKNSCSLFSDAVPKSWNDQAVCALSRILRRQGESGEQQAEAMLRKALMHAPSYGISAEFAHLLAFRAKASPFHLEDEDPAFAEPRYEAMRVLDADPAHSVANEALAIVEMKERKWGSALKRLELACAKGKDDSRLDRYAATCREHVAKDKKEPGVQK